MKISAKLSYGMQGSYKEGPKVRREAKIVRGMCIILLSIALYRYTH